MSPAYGPVAQSSRPAAGFLAKMPRHGLFSLDRSGGRSGSAKAGNHGQMPGVLAMPGWHGRQFWKRPLRRQVDALHERVGG